MNSTQHWLTQSLLSPVVALQGLGKTVICLALIIAKPPPKEIRILPREHKLVGVSHSEYLPPPSVQGATRSSAKTILSNGCLVVAPLTLCSQWQAEVKKFAPQLSVLTLHSGDKETLEDIAAKSIVVVSTFVLNSHVCTEILNKLRRIHWHRLIVDER